MLPPSVQQCRPSSVESSSLSSTHGLTSLELPCGLSYATTCSAELRTSPAMSSWLKCAGSGRSARIWVACSAVMIASASQRSMPRTHHPSQPCRTLESTGWYTGGSPRPCRMGRKVGGPYGRTKGGRRASVRAHSKIVGVFRTAAPEPKCPQISTAEPIGPGRARHPSASSATRSPPPRSGAATSRLFARSWPGGAPRRRCR